MEMPFSSLVWHLDGLGKDTPLCPVATKYGDPPKLAHLGFFRWPDLAVQGALCVTAESVWWWFGLGFLNSETSTATKGKEEEIFLYQKERAEGAPVSGAGCV